jgi:hypothetical protein
MTRATRELLAALAKLNQEVPVVVLGILDESLPPDKQVEFGDLLITAGEGLRHHARNERPTVIDSHAAEAGQGETWT